jgi:glutathione S-transferase
MSPAESHQPKLLLHVLSLRYSSWSIRPWLALTEAAAPFEVRTATLDGLAIQGSSPGPALAVVSREQLEHRRTLGSVSGLFPVLEIDGVRINESLAICEWVADTYPEARLWPSDPVTRAQARAVSCEMVAGFRNLRTKMSCNTLVRIPDFLPDAATRGEIARVFEIWSDCLSASGGPFLFGSFGIADCMYFPVLTRFRTYGVELDRGVEAYAARLEAHGAVQSWREVAKTAPAIPAYDDYVRSLGGKPVA